MRIKKNDQVIVLTGKDKGKTGKVAKVFPAINKVLVDGVAQVKKHQKPTQQSPGGIVTKEMPIHISNVAHVDPESASDKPRATRVRYEQQDGKKVRVAVRSNKAIGA